MLLPQNMVQMVAYPDLMTPSFNQIDPSTAAAYAAYAHAAAQSQY